MIGWQMIWVFTLPDQMARATHKNDVLWIEKAELVRKMMCVHSQSATDSAHAAVTVVNQPADLLPTGRIHEFFVGHGNMYSDPFDFCRVDHEILEGLCAMVGTTSSYLI